MIRRTIQEIIAIHQLEPKLRDVYVEGNNDCQLITWFFGEIRNVNIVILAIALIEVPDELVENHGLNTGSNRSRVIALAYELHESGISASKVKCIVDLDFEPYMPLKRKVPLIEFTDYNSMESYLFNSRTIDKFLHLVIKGFPLNGDSVLARLSTVALRLFAIRLTNEMLQWCMKWVQPRKYISYDEDTFEFDEEGFLVSYLNTNVRAKELHAFVEKLNEVTARLRDSILFSARGHDLTYLFFLLVKSIKKGCKFTDPEIFERAFLGCVEFNDLNDKILFQTLCEL